MTSLYSRLCEPIRTQTVGLQWRKLEETKADRRSTLGFDSCVVKFFVLFLNYKPVRSWQLPMRSNTLLTFDPLQSTLRRNPGDIIRGCCVWWWCHERLLAVRLRLSEIQTDSRCQSHSVLPDRKYKHCLFFILIFITFIAADSQGDLFLSCQAAVTSDLWSPGCIETAEDKSVWMFSLFSCSSFMHIKAANNSYIQCIDNC